MTASEFKEEFNLRYNNALQGAPGLDTYEISAYLTTAQEQIVKKYYDVTKDPTVSFEIVEKARRVLNELVKEEKIYESSSFDNTQNGIFTKGANVQSLFTRWYEINGNVMYIVLETLSVKYQDLGRKKLYGYESSSFERNRDPFNAPWPEEFKGSNLQDILSNKGVRESIIRVIPTTHDDIINNVKNPFKRPNKRKAFRIDLAKKGSKTLVEIIADDISFQSYNVRYVEYPKPIIIENLNTASDTQGLGLTINGSFEQATCVLAELVHREIIDRAVELSVADYRDGTLQSRIQLDSRI